MSRVQVLTNASIVTGTLSGLAEGIGFWKAGEITDEQLKRLQDVLADIHLKAKAVSEAILTEMEAAP